MVITEFIRELLAQLDDDLLQYAFVLQLARDSGVGGGSDSITELVYNAVTTLLENRLAEIGDARLEDDKVEFCPWAGSLEQQKSRLRREIDCFGINPSLGDGFWLARRLPTKMN